MRICLVLLILISATMVSFSQENIKGKIIDNELKYPLFGANIIIKNTSNGTVSNSKGEFTLSIPSFPVILVISYVGYATQEIIVEQSSILEIKMIDVPIEDDHYIIVYDDTPIRVTMPAPLMVLYRRQLQRDNDIAITPALNRVPGVYMHSGALNTNRLTIRGIGNRSLFSTTKIRAYLDDIPLTTGDGETTIEDIDMSIFDKVNVWKGPTASMYGAGLGGMIHLQTNRNWSFAGERFLSSKISFGSYGLVRNTTDLSFSNKKNTVNFKINYNNTHSDGYRENNEYDREGITVLGKIKSDEKNVTTLLLNFKDVKSFIPSSLSRTDYDENPRKAAFTWGNVKGFEDYEKLLLGVSHQTEIASVSKYFLKNKTSVFSSFRNAYESRPFNILDENSQSLGFRTSFDLDKMDGHLIRPFPSFTMGLEVFRENYKWQTFVTNDGTLGDNLSNNFERRNYINLFAQTFQEIGEDWSLLAGVNINRTNYNYEDRFFADSVDLSGDYSFDWVLSPRIGVSYELKEDMALFATVSHGFSPPTLEETLTPDGAINPEIQPEKGWNFEIGSRGKFQNKFSYELTVYQMLVRDLLVAERVGADQFIGINAGETRHSGIEAFGEYLIVDNLNKLSAFVSYTYKDYEFVDFVNGDNDFSNNKLTGTSPHHLNLGIDFKLKQGIYGNVNYQYVDAFPMRDDNSIDSDAYQLTNLKIGYKKLFYDKFLIDIYGGIQNIFDEKYASMILINASSFGNNPPRYYYPGLPRNYFGGIQLKWYY